MFPPGLFTVDLMTPLGGEFTGVLPECITNLSGVLGRSSPFSAGVGGLPRLVIEREVFATELSPVGTVNAIVAAGLLTVWFESLPGDDMVNTEFLDCSLSV